MPPRKVTTGSTESVALRWCSLQSLVAIVAIAALSIDMVMLYLAKQKAQGSADGAALGAARVLSLSGVTGDPHNATGY